MSKLIAKNPVARHNYSIEDTIETGIVLTGTEIKSIRNGKVNLKDSYAGIKNGELFIYNMHISPYEFGNIYNKDPLRDRKLLVNKREINKLVTSRNLNLNLNNQTTYNINTASNSNMMDINTIRSNNYKKIDRIHININ